MDNYNITRKSWTDQEREALRELYPDLGVPIWVISDALDRTEASIKSMAWYLKIKRQCGAANGEAWTDQDREILRKHYPDWTISIGEIAEKLNRTNASVRSMARYLGLKRHIPDMEGIL